MTRYAVVMKGLLLRPSRGPCGIDPRYGQIPRANVSGSLYGAV